MKIRSMNINGRSIRFYNEHRDTRNGFAHDTTLMIDGKVMQRATIRYINRTWERYGFQSVMLEAVDLLEKAKTLEISDEFKRENGIKLVRGEKRKAALAARIAENDSVKFLEAIRHDLKTHIA